MTENLDLDPTQLYFLPLGGSEQFGVNFNLYATQGKWLAVDCGIGFADWRFPGVDILLPDPAFIEERRENLAALIITHAHEDHIGAVPYLWPRLKCPVYCTEFTATVLRKKLEEYPEAQDMEINVVKAGDIVDIKPFKIQFVHVAHSILEATSLVIETKAGRVVHSGDWNLDPDPVFNGPTDEATFKKIGKKGVIAYIGDSTNCTVPGRAGSETEAAKGLNAVFKTCEGRIAVTMFASNVSRIHSIAMAAKESGRRVAVMGRSLHTMIGSAKKCGYLDDLDDFLSEEEMDDLLPEEQVWIVTGSQGEARAALAKIAKGERSALRLEKGDTVIFSSRPIPGNETDINVVKNNLVAAGVEIITDRSSKHRIHISGHPYRDEVADMYDWLKPKTIVSVHGERLQLEAQGELAESKGIENIIIPNNGSIVCLGPDEPEIIDHVKTGVLAVEPKRVIRSDHQGIIERRKMQFTGVLHVSLVMNERGDLVTDPKITTLGLLDLKNSGEEQIEIDLLHEIEDILSDMVRDDLYNAHAVQEEVRIGLRRFIKILLGMKPKTTVHVMRV